MTQLSRRTLFAGAAAAARSRLRPLRARARCRAAGRQAGPGFYRYKVGELRVHVDQRRRAHVPDAGYVREERSQGSGARRGRSRLHAEGHDDGAVQSDDHQHRLEAGADRHRLRSGHRAARSVCCPPVMAAAGIDPKAIDIVVLSHLHPDHINGVKTADGKARVPQCRDQGAGAGLGVLDERRQHAAKASRTP